MKVVHLSTSDKGGAGIAAMRLHKELLLHGIDSHILTKYRLGPPVRNHSVFNESYKPLFTTSIKRFIHNKLYKEPIEIRISNKHLKNRPQGYEYFSFPFSDINIENHPLLKSADIVHLHWVSEGFINYSSFFKSIKKKLVWTLHDMNPFTGGCHHSDACQKFKQHCNNCPQLEGTIDMDYASKMQEYKKDSLKDIDDDQLKIVTPSIWLKNKSAESRLFKRFGHYFIPNGISEKVFYPRNKMYAKEKLKLPLDKKIILFVSNEISNKRKGIHLLEKALNLISEDLNLALCTLGHKSVVFKVKFSQYPLNFLASEEDISMAFSAADVFVLPSMAENFPNTICESLFCDTPVIAFNVGGIPEQISNRNGLLVEAFDIKQLANAIEKVINSQFQYNNEISKEAIMKYSISSVAKEYIRLYNL